MIARNTAASTTWKAAVPLDRSPAMGSSIASPGHPLECHPSRRPSTLRFRPGWPFGGVSVTERSSFVVVANRLPVDEVNSGGEEAAEGGGRNWRRSPGGLVTALQPVLAA